MKTVIELSESAASGEYPFPIVTLRVRDRYGLWVNVLFHIDSGASTSALPIPLARQQGIGYQQTNEGRVRGLVGVTRRFRDRIHVKIGNHEHDWPCDFIEPSPQAQEQGAGGRYGVIGRAGFLDDYAFAIDSGVLIITRLGPVRRLLRRWLHRFWAVTGQIKPADRPL